MEELNGLSQQVAVQRAVQHALSVQYSRQYMLLCYMVVWCGVLTYWQQAAVCSKHTAGVSAASSACICCHAVLYCSFRCAMCCTRHVWLCASV
jgi:hypothetical protein